MENADISRSLMITAVDALHEIDPNRHRRSVQDGITDAVMACSALGLLYEVRDALALVSQTRFRSEDTSNAERQAAGLIMTLSLAFASGHSPTGEAALDAWISEDGHQIWHNDADQANLVSIPAMLSDSPDIPTSKILADRSLTRLQGRGIISAAERAVKKMTSH